MLSNGCGALDLREKKRAEKEKEIFDFAREKWCLGGGLKFFRGLFVFLGV